MTAWRWRLIGRLSESLSSPKTVRPWCQRGYHDSVNACSRISAHSVFQQAGPRSSTERPGYLTIVASDHSVNPRKHVDLPGPSGLCVLGGHMLGFDAKLGLGIQLFRKS